MATKEKPIRPDLKKMKELRQRHPGVLFVFRLGKRCVMYGEDAERAEKVIGIARRGGAAYFEADELEKKLRTLIAARIKVAVCDPIEK